MTSLIGILMNMLSFLTTTNKRSLFPIFYKSIPYQKNSLGNYNITQGIQDTNSYLSSCLKSFLVNRPLPRESLPKSLADHEPPHSEIKGLIPKPCWVSKGGIYSSHQHLTTFKLLATYPPYEKYSKVLLLLVLQTKRGF
jgi:hypothetical protein